jgi:hypothetical protein
MKTAAVRFALALYPPTFRRRFAGELLTTLSEASQAIDASQAIETDGRPTQQPSTSEHSHPADAKTDSFVDVGHVHYRDVLNLALHGVRARWRSKVPLTNTPSTKLRRISTWLLLLGTITMAYKLGAFRTPNDLDRQQATAKGLTFHGSAANNLKFWRYEFGDLLRNNTPTGGDMGSHVWAADALRRDILPQWRLTGWSNDWYAGMPLLSFYFPLPMLAIAALSTIAPFGIAFKIITAIGSLGLPFVTRKAMLRFGAPTSAATLSALGMFAVLFGRFYDWTAYGGTLFSTMSGEFSFSLSSCLAVAFLGSFAHLMNTGTGRSRTALLLAGTGLCHLLPTIWAIAGALIIALLHVRRASLRRQFVDAGTVAMLGAGLAGFWLFPFAANLDYTNSMGWERKKNFVDSLFPFGMTKPLPDSTMVLLATLCCATALLVSLFTVVQGLFQSYPESGPLIGGGPHPRSASSPTRASFLTGKCGSGLLSRQDTRSKVLSVLSAVCVVLAAVLWWSQARGAVLVGLLLVWIGLGSVASWKGLVFNRAAYCLSVLWVSCGLVFVQAPEFRLWNARVLPFWFLTMFLLAGIGSVHIVRLASRTLNWFAKGQLRTLGIDARVGLGAGAAVVFVGVGLPVGLAPAALPIPKFANGMIGVQQAKNSTDRSGVQAWTAHNYGGYEGQGAWPEYKGVMDTAAAVGKKFGCGRAMWEYEEKTIEKYGTTLALTLLPYWTKGCIGSMEGVYYESSPTTPVHFRTASLVNAPRNEGLNGQQKVSGLSNPQRNLAYPTFDLDKGINELRSMGVRYYLAVTSVAVAAAAQSRQLVEVGLSPAIDPVTKAPRTQWHFYEITNNALVAPVSERPVVVKGIGQAQDNGWLDTSMAALNDRALYPKTLVTNGPKEWERADVTIVKRPIDTTYGTGVHLSGPSVRPALQTLKSCWKHQAAQSVTTQDVPALSPTPSVTPSGAGLITGPPSTISQRSALNADSSPPKRTKAPGVNLSADGQRLVDQACANPGATPIGLSAVQPSLPTTTISKVHQTRNSISFHTSTPGVPVVVRLSYFPNWEAKGAKGPFRTVPNFMTVVPTTNNVTLTYGRRPVDVAGELATGVSLVIVLGGWIRYRRRNATGNPLRYQRYA